MTAKRRDGHSTEFGLWLREQPEIDSKIGFRASNIDYMWENYKTGEWMLIEEKRKGSEISWWQKQMFQTIHTACKNDKNFRGIHLLVFENTNPGDGKIFWDKQEITKEELIKKLRFEL